MPRPDPSSPPATARRWELHAPSAVPASRLGAHCLAPCLAALAGSLLPAHLGYPGVTWFALAQTAAVLLVCHHLRRHADDAEVVTLQGEHVLVEWRHGGRVRRVTLDGPWWRVRSGEAAQDAWGAIEIVAPRARVVVGRGLDAIARDRVAAEMRRALCAPLPNDLPQEGASR